MHLLARSIVGNRFAKSAIETALYDAMGRRKGVSVAELLGGQVHDRLPVLWTLASGDTGRDIIEAEEMVARKRHNIFKLKIGKRDIAQDVAHVGKIKAALGDKASVRVDVNMAWTEVEARRAIAMLVDVGCDLVEQPIAGSNLEGMARLRNQAAIPIMADEGLTGPNSALQHIASHACDVFAIKIEQSGGLRAAQHVQAIAEAAGVAVYGGTMLEAGVSTIASAHVFATFPRLDYGTELFGPLLLTQEILRQPLDYSDFALTVPTGPGLGIDLDDDAVTSLRRDRSKTFSVSQSARA